MFYDEYNNGDYDCHNNDNSSPNQNENKPVVFIYKKNSSIVWKENHLVHL